MRDPGSLYWLETGTHIADLRARVMVVSLTGFIDAGHAGRLLTEQVLKTLDHQLVATFDVDELMDYRGRRPSMVFDSKEWESFSAPELLLYRVLDDEGHPFLLLTGQEPDYQWERVIAAIRQLQRMFGVDLTISAYGIPMAVPHTRPIGLTRHATVEELHGDQPSLFGMVQVPGSLDALLHLRLKEDQQPAVGFAIHVPHYLMHSEYAEAAVAAAEAVAEVAGLKLPDTALRVAAAAHQQAIEEEVASSDEARQIIGMLEEQYDRLKERKDQLELMSSPEFDVPTAEEIGEQFEQFLKQYNDPPPDAFPRGGSEDSSS